MRNDWRTSMVGGLCGLISIALTVLLAIGKLDATAYTASLAGVAAFGVSLIGIFSRDAKNKTP